MQNLNIEDDRAGLSIPTLRRAIADNLLYLQEKFPILLPSTITIWH